MKKNIFKSDLEYSFQYQTHTLQIFPHVSPIIDHTTNNNHIKSINLQYHTHTYRNLIY